jgi:hypothetical protein
MSQVIFILIILYCVSSVNVLLLALGILPYIPGAYLNPYVLIAFSIISFALTLLISAFHLSTMIRRKKRRCDRIPDDAKVCKTALA